MNCFPRRVAALLRAALPALVLAAPLPLRAEEAQPAQQVGYWNFNDFWGIDVKNKKPRPVAASIRSHPSVSDPSTPAAPDSLVARSAADYGQLTTIETAIDTQCSGTGGVAVHPSGAFVYLNGFGSPGLICGYAITGANALALIGGASVATGPEPRGMIIEPSGRYLYVVSASQRVVHGYAIDPTSGALTAVPGSPFATGGLLPSGLVAHPNGRMLYVANYQSVTGGPGNVHAWRIERATGALMALAGSPFAVVDGNVSETVTALAIAPDGNRLYAGGNGVTSFAVASDGTLVRSGQRANVFTTALAVDATGRFLVATDLSRNAVISFKLGQDGSMTAAGSAAVGADARAVATVSDLVYVASAGANAIHGFRLQQASGSLTALVGTPLAVPDMPNALATRLPLRQDISMEVGDYFVSRIYMAGGTPPYTFAVSAGSLPPGLAMNAATGVISGTPMASGAFSFAITSADATGTADARPYRMTVAGAATPILAAIEYYNAALDHYFITHVADEIAKLDAGTVIKGWVRTGKWFPVYTSAQAMSSPVCRYYIPPNLGDSHFFGRGTAECNATGQKNPSFVLEDGAFMHMVLPAAGVCPTGTGNVYRVFSNRPDANHRYMTDAAVRNEMVAKGWLAEGDGPELVVMCAPQ